MKTIAGTAATTLTATAWTNPSVSPFARGQRVFFRVAAVNVIGLGTSAQTPGFVTVQ
jgi:hypothetical protein